MRALVVTWLVLAGCGSDTYLVVTVEARSSVHDATKLEITSVNAGTTKISSLDLDGHAFPVTFSLSAPGHTGPLDFSIKALTTDGFLAGLGSGSTTLESSDATVSLDPADFVVNTDVADDQFLTTDFETVGFQLASTTDGDWTVGFGSKCTECNLFSRRFDPNGVAVKTAAAGASQNQFPVTTMTAQPNNAFPAMASSGTATIAAWDFIDVTDVGTGVGCRSIDAMGAVSPGQLSLATDPADTVSATPLSNGNFAVTWQVTTPANQIRSIVALPDCTTLSVNPVAISTTVGTSGPHRASVANNGAAVLYAWITDDTVHIKTASTSIGALSAEAVLVSPPSGFLIEEVRVAAMGSGFAVAARLTATNRTSAGSILLYRVSPTGTLMSATPTVITDKSGSDFSNGRVGFGIATRAMDNATMIVWHQCDDGGGGVCDGRLDVYGRVVRATGAPVGDPFQVPTSTVGNQINPSVVAIPGAFAVSWNDASKTDPDTNGSAVRARLVYPPFDDAASILGAACGGTLPACGMGLDCAMGSDAVARCYESCTPPMCPHGGSCSPALGGGSACTF